MKTRSLTGALAPIALVVILGVSATACSSSPSTSPASEGAHWLSSRLTSQGYVNGKKGPDYGDTAQTAVALEAAGDGSTATRAADYLSRNINEYVDGTGVAPSPTADDAAALAQLILVAHATATDSEFDSSALTKRLLATQQISGATSGLFGASDPTYDGTFRQSLALQALRMDGMSVQSTAVSHGLQWLQGQQCTDGGYSSDAANVPCTGIAANYQGPDTNSTSQALLALAALNQPTQSGSPAAEALTYLSSNELSDAGWGYFGAAKDADSTALVIEALIAQGRSATTTQGTWAKDGRSPMAALEVMQVKSGSQQGGFFFQAKSGPPSVIASEQAVTAVSGVRLPI